VGEDSYLPEGTTPQNPRLSRLDASEKWPGSNLYNVHKQQKSLGLGKCVELSLSLSRSIHFSSLPFRLTSFREVGKKEKIIRERRGGGGEGSFLNREKWKK